MIKLQAAQRLVAAEDWWDALDAEQKKEYIKEHPDSKYAKDHVDKAENKSLTKGPKAPPPVLKEPSALEHPDYLDDKEGEDAKGDKEDKEEPVKPAQEKKPTPKSKDEDRLIRYLLHKGGEAGKKKAKELLKKGGHEALRRLIDPFEMTDIGKKGELPELPFRFKSKGGKIKDLQGKLTKLRKQQKGFGKNVPEHLKKQIKDLSDKLEQLQD
jgi:hypothetical protein